MSQTYTAGQVIDHKLGFKVVVLEINPVTEYTTHNSVKGAYVANGEVKERMFYWQELV